MQIAWRLHPHVNTKSITEIEEEIFLATVEEGALVLPGSWFYAQNDVEHDTLFFRATYAAAPFEKIQEAIRRFGEAVRASFELKTVERKNENGNGV
jgi:aromatic amino acid aminotransferase I